MNLSLDLRASTPGISFPKVSHVKKSPDVKLPYLHNTSGTPLAFQADETI